MNHTCDTCAGSKTRRALKALLLRLPNITTAKAARDLDVNRPHLAGIRKEMETEGCVPPRTVDGRTQGHTERLFRDARTWGNTPRERIVPLVPTLPGEVAYLLAAPGPKELWGYHVGAWWQGVTLNDAA